MQKFKNISLYKAQFYKQLNLMYYLQILGFTIYILLYKKKALNEVREINSTSIEKNPNKL